MKSIFVNNQPAAVHERTDLGEYESHTLAAVARAIGATSVRIAAEKQDAPDLMDADLEANLVEKMNQLG